MVKQQSMRYGSGRFDRFRGGLRLYLSAALASISGDIRGHLHRLLRYQVHLLQLLLLQLLMLLLLYIKEISPSIANEKITIG